MSDDARRLAEAAARVSYGRLVALIARRTRDIAAAEDALAEAFAAALEQWPRTGAPDHPEAWLLTVARLAHSRSQRRSVVAAAAGVTLDILAEEAAMAPAVPAFDRRLELMLVCAHPAIDPAVHTPLMLQAVLGLDAARIATAFLTAPAAISQRLVRAKAKIRDAGIGFEAPGPEALPQRLEAVLAAIYAAYGTGWDDLIGADVRRRGLTEEALYLARLVVDLHPSAPEARGLLALMLYCEARAGARRGADGGFLPLQEQDVALWSRPMIGEAERHLREAARVATYGRFQTEAAIQSVHVQARLTRQPNSAALIQLYDLLAAHDPAIGVLVARAAAHGERRAEDGLKLLDALPVDRVAGYQAFWATRAHLERALGLGQARASYDRAIGLTEDPSIRQWLGQARDAAPP
jgi:RNA polymerase sigma-70 factor, ECF subfamily